MQHCVNGILLLYHHVLYKNAPTIMAHVNAFEQYSRFKVWSVNTELGFPERLSQIQFQAIVLHYSLFGTSAYMLDPQALRYLERSAAYKIAFFQDEHHFCQQRFAFLNQFGIDCVFTLVEPAYFKDVYQKYTHVPRLVYHIPGYVSDDLVELAGRLILPDAKRKIDIGYRGRNLLGYYYMGKGAREKSEVATGFRQRANGVGLKLDIEFEEYKRIYGPAWYRFLANCRAVLGVEAGVSIFDTNDVVRTECERLIRENPKISFEEMSERLLNKWEGNIPYRTISPRHFEAAALRVCQILFEGKYSGIMQPMVHYIPLKKDFSNFDDVIRMFKDKALRRELTENAYRDLIASERYSYRKFIEQFDQQLLAAGLQPDPFAGDGIPVESILKHRKIWRTLRAVPRAVKYYPFPGRRFIVPLVKPLLKRYRDWQARDLQRAKPHWVKEER